MEADIRFLFAKALTPVRDGLSTSARIRGAPILSDAEPRNRLKELETKIEAAKGGSGAGKPRREEDHSQAQIAWRMVTELVAGLGIGFAIGFGLDALAGSEPFMMVTFTLLGFWAGIRTMLRTARELGGEGEAMEAEDDGKRRDDGD